MYRVNNKIYPLSIDKMNTINLSSLEKGEINNYNINTIYFSGSIKKTQIYFTDLELYYIGKIHDHIYFRYEILENLGKGSYSNVFKIYDHKYNKNYALKISKSSEKYNSSIQHEIDILNICKNIYLKEYYEIRAENKLNGKNENNHDIINNNNITNNITNELIALYDTSFIYRNHTMIKLRIYGDNLYTAMGDHWRLRRIYVFERNDVRSARVDLRRLPASWILRREACMEGRAREVRRLSFGEGRSQCQQRSVLFVRRREERLCSLSSAGGVPRCAESHVHESFPPAGPRRSKHQSQ